MLSSALLLALVPSSVLACQRDWGALTKRIARASGHPHEKRQEVEFPPILTETESILVNSFDSKELDSWSYYYTHGDHLGGHNRTMAEWTMEQWASSGWNARIEE